MTERLSDTETTRDLAAFAVDTRSGSLPDGAVDTARLSLFDACAVALAGRDEPVARTVRALVGREGGRAEATVVGGDARLPARAAALANGTACHALDYDDTHFGHIGHPTAAVLPAALAVAEARDATGADFLAAYLIGVESACRLGAALGPEHYRHGFHQTATSGAFGATAACARLLGLDHDTTRHALGLAATRASGLKSQFGTMGKPFHAGMAAANGVEAALLAELGFVSRPDGIECAQGFAATHAAALRTVEVPADRYLFETVQHKLHACCHGTHAALEALLALRRDHAIEAGQVRAVEIATHPTWLRVCDLPEPATGLEAKFSYRLTAAFALTGIDTAALTSFTETHCDRPDLVALRDRVRVVDVASLAETAARVTLELADGRQLVAEHDLADPLPFAARRDKLRAKAATLLGEAPAEALWTTLERLESGPVGALAAHLDGTGSGMGS
ncbi:MAG: MmgE/PrpD family protein [Gammaproteobacteria bacterium]|nr:MmgE/PrpD family protein [Gammaproteobacteria bacterium]